MKAFALKITLLAVFICLSVSVKAVTFDWVGSTSTDWTNSANWKVGGSATALYPGQSGVLTDVVQIGISTTAYTNSPTIASGVNLTVSSITFGNVAPTKATGFKANILIVNGALTVSGNISVNYNNTSSEIDTYLEGAGTINCTNINFGGNSTAKNGNNDYLFSYINTLNISGNVNIVINTTIANGSGFRLDNGNMYLAGQINITNPNNATTTSQYKNFGYFTIERTYGNSYGGMTSGGASNPNLYFSNANPILATATPYGSVNLNGNRSGSGTPGVATVIYTNPAANIVTTSMPGFGSGGGTIDVSVPTYDNLTITSAVTNGVVGSGAGNLFLDGDFTNAGVTSFASYTTATDVNGSLNNSGTFNMGSGTLNVAVNYTNSSVFAQDATDGLVTFDGTAAQTLNDVSAAGTLFYNVAFSNAGVKTISSGTGNFKIAGTGVLTMNSPAQLVAGTSSAAYLTLLSDATGTATVASLSGYTVSSTNPPISGFVNVQRYFKGQASGVTADATRNYRLLSSPVNSGANATGNYSLKYLNNNPGVFIAGPTGATGGFTVTNATPTSYLYIENLTASNTSFNSGNFKGITDISSGTLKYYTGSGVTTSTATLPAGNGFMLYYAGSNTVNTTSATSTTGGYNKQTRYNNSYGAVDASTTTATGTLNQGSVPVTIWWSGSTAFTATKTGYNLLGNPYAASINWDTFSATSSSNGIYGPSVNNTIYIFNYSTKNYSAYQANVGGTNGGINLIASGQGFFVKAAAAGATLTFNENAKSNIQPAPSALIMAVKRQMQPQSMRLKLAKDSINTDDVLLLFEPGSKNEYEPGNDAERLAGIGNLSTLASYAGNSSRQLAINHMAGIDSTTRVKLYVNVSGSSTIDSLIASGLSSLDTRYDAYLIDHYKRDSLLLSKYPKYVFNISQADTSSFGANRFEVVFHKNPVAAGYHLLGFDGIAVSGGAQLTWKVDNEQDFTGFTLQRMDGSKQFIPIYQLQSDGRGTYTYLDKGATSGANYYQLMINDAFAHTAYSSKVTVVLTEHTEEGILLSVYPNPASGRIQVTVNSAVNNMNLQIRVMSSSGRLVASFASNESKASGDVSGLKPGTYIIEATDAGTKKLYGRKMFVKL